MPRRARALAIAALGLLLGLALIAPAGALSAGRPAAVATRPLVRAPRPQDGADRPISTARAVPATALPLASGTLGHRLRAYFSKSSTLVLLGVLVVCSLVLVLLRRRATRPRQRPGKRTADGQ